MLQKPNHQQRSTLITDTRERNVYRHKFEFDQINHSICQITTGDYVVMSPTNAILAVIERKSLQDFAASLKDGRHSNKDKLVALRNRTNCRIIFIIEGPLDPGPNDYFGNIAYRNIESAIFHLMVRDGVTVLKTKDDLDTAKTLMRFMASMDTLTVNTDEIELEKLTPLFQHSQKTQQSIQSGEEDTDDTTDDTNETTQETKQETPQTSLKDTMALLTAVHTTSDNDLVRTLWSCFPGIAVTTADDFMRQWSVADIVRGKISHETLAAHKSSTGRAISKKVLGSITNVHQIIQIRLLANIPGISRATAMFILSQFKLSDILSWEIGGIGMLCVSRAADGKKAKRLGDKVAERILRLFNYKFT